MKRLIPLTIAAVLGLTLSGHTASEHKKTYTLTALYDLDGAAASATAIHSADTITDSASFTIDAQPDVPRVLQATLTDADASISACQMVVNGTLADGSNAQVLFTLTGGSGVKTGTPAGVYFKTVLNSSVGVCTGEGAGDAVSLGTSSSVAPIYFKPYGRRFLRLAGDLGSQRAFDLDWNTDIKDKVAVDEAAAVPADATKTTIFANIQVGAILQLQNRGVWYERVVTAKASDDSLTLDGVINNDLAAMPIRYRNPYFGPDTDDGALPVGGFEAGSFVWLFHVLGNDAKVRLQCRVLGAGSGWVTVDNSAITASATLVTKVVSVDFRLAGYDECRAGLEWATVDTDGDAGAELESITVQFVGTLGQQ